MEWFFDGLNPWHWVILGVLLIILEVAAPGVVFLWIGMAGIATGLVKLVIPSLGWEVQVLVFAVLALIFTFGGRQFVKRRMSDSEQPLLNQRGAQYVGRTFNLSAAIVNGAGKIKVDDSTWKVTGADLPEGARVRVTGVNGTVLQVEPAD